MKVARFAWTSQRSCSRATTAFFYESIRRRGPPTTSFPGSPVSPRAPATQRCGQRVAHPDSPPDAGAASPGRSPAFGFRLAACAERRLFLGAVARDDSPSPRPHRTALPSLHRTRSSSSDRPLPSASEDRLMFPPSRRLIMPRRSGQFKSGLGHRQERRLPATRPKHRHVVSPLSDDPDWDGFSRI